MGMYNQFHHSSDPNGTDGVDVKGHGAHVAGIAGGSRWGIAKGANLIALKVIDDEGHGRQSYNLTGLEYVFIRRLTDGRPSIINMRYGGQKSESVIMDLALMMVTSVGIHVTAAAGNKNVDAIYYTQVLTLTSSPLGFRLRASPLKRTRTENTQKLLRKTRFNDFLFLTSCLAVFRTLLGSAACR